MANDIRQSFVLSKPIKISFLFLPLIFCAGCKKISKDYADVAEPEDRPAYTTEYNKNVSPAAGSPKKP